MGKLFNYYSLMWIAGILLIVLGILFFRQKPKLANVISFGVVIVGLAYAWTVIRPRQTMLMDNAQAVQDMIGQGQPILLEFQSPY